MTNRSDERPTTHSGPGPVPPALTRPKKDDMREVGIVAAILLVLSLGVGAYWMYQAQTDGQSNKDSTRATATRESWKRAGDPVPGASASKAKPLSAAPVSSTIPEAGRSSKDQEIRVDVYFDFDRSTLNRAAQRILKKQVDRMLAEEGWTVLIQGYTDKLGPVSYNKALGLRRAQAAKRYLMTLGVPEHSIRVSGVGEDAAVCRGNTGSCGKMKRRAHLQWSKVDRGVLTSAGVKRTPQGKGATADDSKVATDRKGDRAGKPPLTTADVSP